MTSPFTLPGLLPLLPELHSAIQDPIEVASPSGEGETAAPWILATGVWNDAGTWNDMASWKDK